jgi:hypothetical protein
MWLGWSWCAGAGVEHVAIVRITLGAAQGWARPEGDEKGHAHNPPDTPLSVPLRQSPLQCTEGLCAFREKDKNAKSDRLV